jgi:ATP-dependent DNA helicase RecQ
MLERMVFYGQTGQCRWKVLLENFDAAEGFERCGTCDNCVRIAAAFAAAERDASTRDRDAQAADADRGDERAAANAPALPKAGDLVSVPRYGRGVVESVSAEGVTVVFPEGARRVFLPAFVRAAAARARRPRGPAKVTASAS